MRSATSLVAPLAFCAVLGAQSPIRPDAAPAADPAPAPSRFDEAWDAAPEGSSLGRRLKHVPLLSGDRAWVTFGLTARLRVSDTRSFLFSSAPAMDDSFVEWRMSPSADAWVGRRNAWHLRAFAELRDAQALGRSLPGGARPSDADRTDWQDLFAELGHGPNGLRVGRQDVALGRERLVGLSDWANARRAFEGVRGSFSRGRLQITAFGGRVVEVRVREANRPDATSHLRFASATRSGAAPISASWRLAGWQAYVIGDEQQSGLVERLTTGGRLWGDRRGKSIEWSGEVEAASQTGSIGARSLRAWFAVAEGGATWYRARWTPSLTAGVDVGSGTGPDSATRAGTFAPPYATAHAFNGIADVFGRGNLLERRLGVGARPRPALQLFVVARHFSRVRTEDGVYSKANAVLRPSPGLSVRSVADEVDLTARWNVSPRLRVEGGGAWVGAGDFIKATGSAAPIRWMFLSTSLAF